MFIYTMFKAKEEMSVSLLSLMLLFGVVLILSHTVAAMSMALFLLTFWLGFEIYKAIYNERFEVPSSWTLCFLFIVSMFSWWMYESGHIMTIAQLIQRGLRIERWEHSSTISQYVLEHARAEIRFNMFGFTLYMASASIGLFYMWSRKSVTKYLFTLALSGWVLLGIAFFLPLLGFSGIAAGRWYNSLELITAIPLAIGLLWLCEPLKNRLRKASLLAILVFIICFMSITRPNANIDNPIYSPNTMFRHAYIESELKAADTISNIYQGQIVSDYTYPFHQHSGNEPDVASFKLSLISGDYSNIEGLVVVRKEIVEGVSHINGPYRLDHEPGEKLADLNFSCIYNSGTVSAFLKK